MSISKKHFHTFDAFRFFSFLLVFFHHVPIIDNSFIDFFSKSGGVGVGFFFVLSGFLITYILLHEKLNTDKISLKNFFIRRILRIWPLFYAMILFAFLTPFLLELFNFSSSGEGYDPQWLWSLSFFENYKMMLTDSFPNISPLRIMWSLCIEEHFYILWGISFLFISVKRIPYLLGISILIANITRLTYYKFGIEALDVFSNLDFFAWGAIPAYILLMHQKIIDHVDRFSKPAKRVYIFFTVVALFSLPNFDLGAVIVFIPTILGLLFSIAILFTLTEKNAIRINDSFFFSKLGKYTYGLYLYHIIVINLLIQTANLFPFQLNWFSFGLISLTITILISISSYHLFEKHFLKLKKYFY